MAAFEELVARYERTALGVAGRFLGDRHEAEDVAQEAFLKVLDAAERYIPAASFTTYLYAVISRLCMDRARKRRPVCLDDPPEPAPAPSTDDLASARERDRAVSAALDRLPARQRMAVVLRHFEGLSYTDIAEAIGVSVKGVERLLARARQSLAGDLGRQSEDF
jgi:RNA polymerase sigma-70 factor (ECF subfamily)